MKILKAQNKWHSVSCMPWSLSSTSGYFFQVRINIYYSPAFCKRRAFRFLYIFTLVIVGFRFQWSCSSASTVFFNGGKTKFLVALARWPYCLSVVTAWYRIVLKHSHHARNRLLQEYSYNKCCRVQSASHRQIHQFVTWVQPVLPLVVQ